jgi:hypothetical protein
MFTSNTISLAYLQLRNDLTRSLVGGYAPARPGLKRPSVRGHRNRIRQGPDGVWMGIHQTVGKP